MSKTTARPKFTGKRLTPRGSIRKFCGWCNGGCLNTCSSSSCALYPYRMTKVEPGDRLSPLRSIREFCLGCAESSEGVRTCAAFKPFSEAQPECPLWPHRDGKRCVSTEYREKRREQAKRQLREPGPGATFAPQERSKEQS